MTGLGALIRRNSKLYFKDKGMFFTSLITPMILLVLYVTFLSRTYEDSFRSALAAAGAQVEDSLLHGLCRRAAHLVAAGRQLCDGGLLLEPHHGVR